MSLINEALKRTRDTSFQSTATRSDGANVYRIESGAPASAVGSRSGVWATLVVAVIALAVGTVLATRFIKHARSINAGFTDIVASSDTPTSAPAVSKKSAPEQPHANEANTKTADDKLVAKVVEKLKAEQSEAAEPLATPPAPPSRPELPKLVLQGITSEGSAREAMINGLNLHEGDDVEGARVVSIEPRRVKLQFDGRDILLRLP
jgi:hypothetical protein